MKSKISWSPATVSVHGHLEELLVPLGPRRGRGTRRPRWSSIRRRISALGEVADGAQALDEAAPRPAVRTTASTRSDGEVAAGDQAAQVHLDQLRHADVVAEQVPDVGDLLAGAEQPHRRDAQRLLVALGRRRRERPDHHAAHVHQVGRDHHPGHQPVVDEDRPLHHHVLGVQPAAVVRVVGEEHVARGQRRRRGGRSSSGTAWAAAPKWNSTMPVPTIRPPSASSSVTE